MEREKVQNSEATNGVSLVKVRAAVSQVLEYLEEDERSHCESSHGAERIGHILESLDLLRSWLESDMSQAEGEVLRRNRLAEINHEPGSRTALEGTYGQVWDTAELQRDFVVQCFMAPFVEVCRKSDQQRGTLEFQHNPRFFFNFQPD